MQPFRILITVAVLASIGHAWICPDDGATTALSNNQVAGNYRIHNTGLDKELKIVITASDGTKTEFKLPKDSDGVLVGVPLGATVTIEDPKDDGDLPGVGTIAQE